MRSVLPLSTALLLATAPLEAQLRHALDTVPHCTTCSLRVTHLFSLGTEHVGRFVNITADRRGYVYASTEKYLDEIRIFDPRGIPRGRITGGPKGPFREITALVASGDDSLHVIDFGDRTHHVFLLPSREWVRSASFPFATRAAVFSSDGSAIIPLSVPTPGSIALPLHQVSADGAIQSSFGTEVLTGPHYAQRLARTIAPVDDGFVVAHTFSYTIERWSGDLTLVAVFEGNSGGLGYRYEPSISLQQAPQPFIRGAWQDTSDRLWVARASADQRYRSAARNTRTERGTGVQVVDPVHYYDGWLDIVDSQGKLLVSRRFDAIMTPLGHSLFYSAHFSAGDPDQFRFWRIEFVPIDKER